MIDKYTWWLMEISDKPDAQKIALARGTTTLGRFQNSDITIDDPLVSRDHASIFLENDMLYINDLNSRNGVFVNECLVEQYARLYHSDTMRIGKTEFKITQIPLYQPKEAIDLYPDPPTDYMRPAHFSVHTITIPEPEWESLSALDLLVSERQLNLPDAVQEFFYSVYHVSSRKNELLNIDLTCIDDLIREVINQVLQHCGGSNCTLRVFNPSDWRADLIYQVNRSQYPPSVITLDHKKSASMISERLIFIIQNAFKYKGPFRRGTMSLLCAPLINGEGQVIGSVEMINQRTNFEPTLEYTQVFLIVGHLIDELINGS